MKQPSPLALMLLLLAGCAASSTPNYDLHFGEAVRLARQRMVIDNAPPAPPPGMDGRAAQDALVRYQDSYKSPPPVVNVINIGGGSSGAAR